MRNPDDIDVYDLRVQLAKVKKDKAYYEFVASEMEDALRSIHGDAMAQDILDEADEKF